MADKTIKLTRRRAIGGLITIGGAAAAAGAGTFALFSDSESSTDNTIQAGTLDLKVDGSDSTTGSFAFSGLKPGGQTHQGTVEISNAGSISPDHLELRFGYTESETDGPNGNNGGDTDPSSATGFATMLEVTTLDYGGTDLLAAKSIQDDNGNGIIDLDDVASDGILDSLAAPGSGTTLTIDLQFVSSGASRYSGSLEDDNFQGDTVTVAIDAALAQQSGQNVLQ